MTFFNRKYKALLDINRSCQTLNGTLQFRGFAERLIRQYGHKTVSKIMYESNLSPVQIGWMNRVLEESQHRKF